MRRIRKMIISKDKSLYSSRSKQKYLLAIAISSRHIMTDVEGFQAKSKGKIFPDMGESFFSSDEDSPATDAEIDENYNDGKETLDGGDEERDTGVMVTGLKKPRKKTKSRHAATDSSMNQMDAKDKALLQDTNSDIPADFVPDSVSGMFRSHDFSYLRLRPDHASRPLWISPNDGRIILESFSPLAEQAQDFLVTIAEPISRPSHIHEYKITAYSLYAAVSVGLETEDIISVLDRLSKVPVAESIINFIKGATISYGKVKLVIKHNRYFVETTQADILQMLLNDSVIGPLRIDSDHQVQLADETLQQELQQSAGKSAVTVNPNDVEAVFSAVIGGDNERDDDDDDIDAVHSFEIANESVEVVKKRCQEIDYPVLEEY